MCQSSHAHQNYTRRWANDLEVPIFSIDYRLAPKYPFPDPVNDCYQAYVWILTHAEEYFSMKIDRFVITGDSAGGYLSFVVSMLAILRGFTKPQAMLCHYPVFSMDLHRFIPSSLIALDEPLLSNALLTFTLACFLRKGGNAKTNPFVSPILCPDLLLSLMPQSHFIAAEIDALRDHSLIMGMLLLRNQVPANISIMKDFVHGYCSMDAPILGPDEYRRGNLYAIRKFKELISDVIDAENKQNKQGEKDKEEIYEANQVIDGEILIGQAA